MKRLGIELIIIIVHEQRCVHTTKIQFQGKLLGCINSDRGPRMLKDHRSFIMLVVRRDGTGG